MRFGHFSEVKENPERGFFDQNGNMLRQELTSQRSVTENLKRGDDFLKKSGAFTPDQEAAAAIRSCSSLLEAGAVAKAMLEKRKKGE